MTMFVYVFVWIMYDCAFAQDVYTYIDPTNEKVQGAVEYALYDCIEYDLYNYKCIRRAFTEEHF